MSDATEQDVDAAVLLPQDDDDATVVVGAAVDADATIVVGRDHPQHDVPAPDAAEAGDDATVVVARGSEPDDATRVVERGARAKEPLAHGEPLTHGEPVMNAPRRRDRRRPAPAPVAADVLRTAEPGAGPGPLERYEVRELEASAPPAPPQFAAGPPPTRDTGRALPSVRRRSRRSAAAAIAVFAGACVVAVGGLTAVAVVVLGELLG